MPTPRSKMRAKAYQLWIDSEGRRPLTSIAEECGVSPEQIRKWKSVDHWSLERGKKKSDSSVTENNGNGNTKPNSNGNTEPSRVTRKRKRAGPGNPCGNLDLPPAQPHNKLAMTNGEYETILYETLSDKEKRLINASVKMDPISSMNRTIATLTVRESRIMARIKDRLALAGSSAKPESEALFAQRVLNDLEGGSVPEASKSNTKAFEKVISFVTEQEEALTRVQARKANAIAMLHRMQRDAILTDFERRKVEVLEQRTAIEQKRFDFEYGRGSGSGQNDPITGWLEATQPTEESISAMFLVEDGEESP